MGFDHLGAPYRTTDEFLAITMGFIQNAIAQGNPVLVAVPGSNLRLIENRLDGHAHRVVLADMEVAGRNPGRIIPGVLIEFATRHEGRRVSIVGEPTWAGRSPTEYPACVTHEALINAAFVDHDAEILCPYDAVELPAAAVADADSTHPVLCDADSRWLNPAYVDPGTTVARFNEPLPIPGDTEEIRFGHVSELFDIRSAVGERGRQAGLTTDRLQALVVAVNELTTNTTRHAGGSGQLNMWVQDDTVICQVTDSGRLVDLLAGRVPPKNPGIGGHGLVMVNQLVDLVRVHVSAQGTAIRLYQRLPVD